MMFCDRSVFVFIELVLTVLFSIYRILDPLLLIQIPPAFIFESLLLFLKVNVLKKVDL